MLIAALRKDLNQVTVTMERATTAGWGKDAELCRSYIIALWDCGEADTAANALATMLKTRASLSAPKEFRILAQVRTAELVLHRNPTIFRYAERADTALLGFDQPRPYAYRKG
mmetsp:Transcript_21195/g.86613  ORF Transcript_21195/g.86613 Transcript_21195/m.86613 type:complete len:113 (+) Transcript_21195:2588-2926(+)